MNEFERLCEWFAEFAAIHPEWANEQFPANTSEGDWLEDLFKATGRSKPNRNP